MGEQQEVADIDENELDNIQWQMNKCLRVRERETVADDHHHETGRSTITADFA